MGSIGRYLAGIKAVAGILVIIVILVVIYLYDHNRQKAHDFSRGMNAVYQSKIHNYLWYTPNI